MSDHVALLRVSALSLVAGLLSNSAPAFAQLSDTPDATYESLALDFAGYDCSAAATDLDRVHAGQVIGGTYREWVSLSKTVDGKRAVRCVSEIAPTSRQLSPADAEALLIASIHGAPFAASTVERAASIAAPDFGHADTGVATKGGALGEFHDPKSYAILDGGFGTTPVGSAAPERSVAAEDDAGLQVPVERTATLGIDERARVSNTNSSPWNTIGQLVVTWRDGTQSICTGTMISPYAVLTAGQCAHNRRKGGFAAKTSFAPGQTQETVLGEIKQSVASRYADYVETTSRWTQISGDETILITDARYDYAVYYFVAPWSHNFTTMPLVFDSTGVATGNHAGYPVSISGAKGTNQTMYVSSGLETSRSSSLLRAIQVREYGLDASTGSIGGPLWTYDGTSRSFVGLVSYGGDDYAGGVWFGGENKTLISTWAAWTPGMGAPQNAQLALHAPLTFPSSTTFAMSLFRFYNPGLVPGAVTVTFANGTTGETLGTWRSPQLPPHSSKQFLVQDMEKEASPPINAAGKDNYTATISADFQGFVQTVIWNQTGVSLTNASGCSNGISNDVSNLINVHTTNITQYPSVILLHNLATRAADAVIGVYDARKGDRLGGIVVPAIAPNAAATFGAADIERVLNYTPYYEHDHYNLVIENDFYGYAQHVVYNNGAGLVVNMTAKCSLRP